MHKGNADICKRNRNGKEGKIGGKKSRRTKENPIVNRIEIGVCMYVCVKCMCTVPLYVIYIYSMAFVISGIEPERT